MSAETTRVLMAFPGKEEALVIARRAVQAGGPPELPPDSAALVASLLVLQDPAEREVQALRGEAWAHCFELWHLARAGKTGSREEWDATLGWNTTAVKLGAVAMFAAMEADRRRGDAAWVSRSALLLFGAAGGVALCVLLRLNGW